MMPPTPIREFPLWLVPEKASRRVVSSTRAAPPETGRIVEGSRNTSIARLGQFMSRGGVGDDAILAALLMENERRCVPPLPEDEIQKIAKSVARYRPADTEGSRAFTFLRFNDILDLPKPEWLIDGVLPAGALAQMYGLPGSFKTFLALDWAFKIGSGQVDGGISGPVVYIYSEGQSGIGKRAAAWGQQYADANPDVHFLMDAVQLSAPREVDAFLNLIADEVGKPVLVVLDTLAACSVGVDENSAGAMGRVVQQLDRIRRETGAAVLVLHHTGKQGKDERGSSVFRGAADMMAEVTSNGSVVTLKCSKMKDAKAFSRMHFLVADVADSCVLSPITESAFKATLPLKEDAVKCLRVLGQHSDGLRHNVWKAYCEAEGVKSGSFKNHLKSLSEHGCVHEAEGFYRVGLAGTAYLNDEH